MKTKLLLICLVLFTSQVFCRDFEYEKEIDEFEGSVTQTLSKSQYYPKTNARFPIQLFRSKNEVSEITVRFVFSMNAEESTQFHYLSIITKSQSWNILAAESAQVLLDGERWNKHRFVKFLGEVSSAPFEDVYAHEGHSLYYNKSDFEKIIRANTLKVRVDSLIYSIDLSRVDFTKLEL